MDLTNAQKLLEKAFLELAEKDEHVSPVDLIAQLQTEMKAFCIYTHDEDDLAEINADPSFDFLKEDN